MMITIYYEIITKNEKDTDDSYKYKIQISNLREKKSVNSSKFNETVSRRIDR